MAEFLEGPEENGEGGQGVQGKPGVEVGHQERSRDPHDDGRGEVQRSRPQQGAEGTHILGRPGHEVSGRDPVVKATIEAEPLTVELVAEVVLNVARGSHNHHPGQEAEGPLEDSEEDERGGKEEESRPRRPLLQSIDSLFEDPRDSEAKATREHDGAQAQEEDLTVGAV